MATVSEVQMLVSFEPLPGAAARGRADRGTNPRVATEILVVYTTSWLLIFLICLSTCGALLVVLCGAALYHKRTTPAVPDWQHNPRLAPRWARGLLLVSVCCLAVGVAWCLSVAAVTQTGISPIPRMVGGLLLTGLGLLLLLGLGLYVARDPVQYHCPECSAPVSRWRFRETYLPPPEGRQGTLKAHTRHVRCVRCKGIVVHDGWAQAMLERPYHDECWQEHCADLITDPDAVLQWYTANVCPCAKHLALASAGGLRSTQ